MSRPPCLSAFALAGRLRLVSGRRDLLGGFKGASLNEVAHRSFVCLTGVAGHVHAVAVVLANDVELHWFGPPLYGVVAAVMPSEKSP